MISKMEPTKLSQQTSCSILYWNRIPNIATDDFLYIG